MGKVEEYITQFDLEDFVINRMKYCEKLANDLGIFPIEVAASWGLAIAEVFGGVYSGYYSLMEHNWNISIVENGYFEERTFKNTKKNERKVIKKFEELVEKKIIEDRKLRIKVELGFTKVRIVGYSQKKKYFLLEPINKRKYIINEKYVLYDNGINNRVDAIIKDNQINNKTFYCEIRKIKIESSDSYIYYCTTFSKRFIEEATEFICNELRKKTQRIKNDNIKAYIKNMKTKTGAVSIRVSGTFTVKEFEIYKSAVQKFLDMVFGNGSIIVNVYF